MVMKTFLIPILICLAIAACRNEAQQARNPLLGKWMITEASRDGEYTETLTDAYFNFIDENSLETNINRRSNQYEYTFEDGVIIQKGSMSATYRVVVLNDSSLVMETKIRNYDFIFKLHRVEDSLQDSLQDSVHNSFHNSSVL